MQENQIQLTIRLSAVACFLAGALLWLGPWLLRSDLFSNDAAHHVFWFYRYADHALFPNDLSIEYFNSNAVAPFGYRALYAGLAPWVDVLTAAEWLSIPLLGLSALLAWRLGQSVNTPDRELVGLLAVVALLVLLPFVDLHPAMAFQRSIALPATLLCLWALASGRYQWVGVSWMAAALFYPVIIPVLGLAAGLVFTAALVRDRCLPNSWLWNAALGGVAILIVLLGSGTPEGVGPMITFEQARLMPEFGPGGRQDLFGNGSFGAWFRHHRTGLGWSPWAVLAVVAALAVLRLRGWLRLVPPAAWVLAGAGVALWFIARLVLFDLYLPNRHARWSLAAFAIIVFALASYAAITWLARSDRSKPIGANLVKAIAVAAPLFVAGSLVPSAHALLSQPVDVDLERAYRFLELLPPDTLVLAHPDLANYVPLRAKRSVLASSEGAIAFMRGYYSRFRPRIETSLRAAYATSWQELDALHRDYGVDVVLTGPLAWRSELYDAGFEELMRELWRKGVEEGFVLKSPPSERVLFRSGDVYVIRLEASAAGDSSR